MTVDLRRLIQLTDKAVMNRSRMCKARVVFDNVVDDDKRGTYLEVILRAHCTGSQHTYTVVFRFSNFGSTKSLLDHPTWARCSCPYFLYYLEVALTRRGSSNVYYSNGRYPKIRNPKAIPYLCKHLIASARPALKVLDDRTKELKKGKLKKRNKAIPKSVRKLMP